jgi:hypothetical protein
MLSLPLAPIARAGPTSSPGITVTTDVEDGKKMLHVVVTTPDGKPIENVVLDYYARRTFGDLRIGEDTTLDDGTSAVAFPSDLPGTADGRIDLVVRVKSPAQYASASTSISFTPDAPPTPAVDPFPRAMWAPQAPLALMATVLALMAGVWGSYAFVVSRILAIFQGGRQ